MADQEQYFQPLADQLLQATETVSANNDEEWFLSGARDARNPARGLLDGNPGRIEPEWWSVMHPNSLLADGVVWFDREKAIYLSSLPPFRAEQIEVEENAFCKVLGLPLRTELGAMPDSQGGPQEAAEAPQTDAKTPEAPETRKEKRARETKEKYKRWYDTAQEIMAEGKLTHPTEIASAIAKREKDSGERGVNARNIRRRLDEHYPRWAERGRTQKAGGK